MDTEKTLDLNKPLFSYSRYERNEYGYGDDFIHRDGDGVDMQVFFNQATGEFVSKGVSISDFTNLVEGNSARDTNAWTRHSLDPKELLPDDISKVEINDGMMAFLKTYRFNVSDEHTGDPIRQVVYDFDFKDADFYSALYGAVGNWPPAVLRGIVDRFAETGTHGLEFNSEYSLPTGYHEKLFDALKSYFKCTGEDYTTIDETIYMEYLGGADVDGYSLKFSPEALVSAVESGSRSLEGELVPLIDYELIGGGKTYEYLPCGCQVDITMNDSMVAASQLLRNLQNAGVDIGKLPNLSCDECSQLAAKVIPYVENKAQSAPDRTRIKKVNEDQPLFPNTGAGLLIQKNKLTDDWTALNVSDGHYEEESFNHEALVAAFLQGANMGQLRMLNEILDRARLNGPYCLENVANALLSFAPACKPESLIEKTFLHFIELSKSFSKNGGIYDPVHGIYIESKVNGMGDVPHFTLYDVSVADIEECMAWGIKHLDEVPRQIHVVNGSPHIATIYVTGPDDRRIYDLIYTLCEDGRWCDVSELNAETLARFNEVIAKANRIEAGIVKDDEWRDGMVEQVSGFMDKIKDMDAEEAEGADTVLAETFNSIDALSTDAAIDLLRVYSNCDASGRDAVAKTFYALSGESFDSYLMTASEVCKKTLGMLEPEPPQPAKTKNLSQKTMSSREASNRLSDEIGVKPCTRDEGTVGE